MPISEWTRVAAVEDLDRNSMIRVVVGGVHVCLVRIGDQCCAVNDICTHFRTSLASGELFPESCEVQCPLHDSRFSFIDGTPHQAPATKAVEVYAVRVENGELFVGPRSEPGLSRPDVHFTTHRNGERIAMASNEVIALGYVVITAEDVPAWSEFATSILGLELGSQPDVAPPRETAYLRLDERSWRFAVESGADGGLAALGLETASKESFEHLRDRLSASGLVVKDAPEVAAHRRVVDLFEVEDPNGVKLEFYYGAQVAKDGFVSPRGTRFVTGDQGMGHAVLLVDSENSYDFYVKQLGFRVSDVLSAGPFKAYFTSPSSRHHSVALLVMPGAGVSLNHVMFEVEDIDMVGSALDRVYDSPYELQSGLGRHSNDHMLSFYPVSPSGLVIEYGFGARKIDSATHSTETYASGSFWGHRLPDGTIPSAG